MDTVYGADLPPGVLALCAYFVRCRWTVWRLPEEWRITSRKEDGISVLRMNTTVNRINADRHLQGVAERASPES